MLSFPAVQIWVVGSAVQAVPLYLVTSSSTSPREEGRHPTLLTRCEECEGDAFECHIIFTLSFWILTKITQEVADVHPPLQQYALVASLGSTKSGSALGPGRKLPSASPSHPQNQAPTQRPSSAAAAAAVARATQQAMTSTPSPSSTFSAAATTAVPAPPAPPPPPSSKLLKLVRAAERHGRIWIWIWIWGENSAPDVGQR